PVARRSRSAATTWSPTSTSWWTRSIGAVFATSLPALGGLTRSTSTPRADRATRAPGRSPLPGSALGARAPELLVRRHVFAHDVEEVVGTGVADELQPAAQIGDRRLEAPVRAQVVAKAPVLAFQLDQLL